MKKRRLLCLMVCAVALISVPVVNMASVNGDTMDTELATPGEEPSGQFQDTVEGEELEEDSMQQEEGEEPKETPALQEGNGEKQPQEEPEILWEESGEGGSPLSLDAEHFPDNAFLAYVKEHFDGDGDGMLSEEELSAVTSLKLPETVKDLSGIELLGTVKKLTMSPGQLAVFAPGGMPQLESLTVQDTKLTYQNLTEHEAVENLDLSQNLQLSNLVLNVQLNSFLNADNCQLKSGTVKQYRSLSIGTEDYYDLSVIPGFDQSRVLSVSGAVRKGTRIYPTRSKVVLKYGLDASKSRVGIFCFTIQELLAPSMKAEILKSQGTYNMKLQWTTPMPEYMDADTESGALVYCSTKKNGKYICLAKSPNNIKSLGYYAMRKPLYRYVKMRCYFKKKGSKTVFTDYTPVTKMEIGKYK